MPTDVELALDAALAGADVVRHGFGRPGSVEFKGAVDPVTEIDREAERVILEVLRSGRPKDGIEAEESGGKAGSGRRWIVDPLDGTINFIHGIPHVGVSVALYDADRPLVGVVVDVLREEEFVAEAGLGARVNGESIRVSSSAILQESLLATGFPYDRQERASDYTSVLGAALTAGRGVRRMGTASLDLAWVACGRYAGFWEFGLAPWDVAAGILLVTEAGGVVTGLDGEAAGPGAPLIIASNGSVHRALIEAISGPASAVLGERMSR